MGLLPLWLDRPRKATMSKGKKRYNHAFTIAWSFDSDLSREEWESRIDTKEGISEACAHLLRRINQVIQDGEVDAFDLWDSYEH